MCGIAGFLGTPDVRLLSSMGDSIAHRGPDQEGELSDEAFSMIHKRLSIIDLSESARQPMTTASGRFTIVYNGELYNYRKLRKRYREAGFRFRTDSDTECFLASAELHGLRDLGEFRGMFAFAVWDARERKLVAARDRIGIKPLFFCEDESRFYFASEIPALLETRAKWRVDDSARAMYLALGYVPGPHTIFEGIASLEPGSVFHLTRGGPRELFRFGDIDAIEPPRSFADAVETLPPLVDRVVARQMISDRPVGLFLSGGLDSSVVLTSMRRASSGRIRTYSTRFRYQGDNPRFNVDADLAARTAREHDCEHHEIEVGSGDLVAAADQMATHLGQPFNNASMMATLAAAERASLDVPVVLGGDGGDEVFGGYHRYRLWARVGPLLKHTPRVLKRLAERVLPRGRDLADLLIAGSEAERLLYVHALPRHVRRAWFGIADDDVLLQRWRERLSAVAATDSVSRFMSLDRSTWLRDESFVRADRMTMQCGIEMRVPLTDDDLLAFARTVPRDWLVDSRRTKRLWRAAFRDRCLPEVIAAEKRGWSLPAGKWLRTELAEWTRSIVSEAVHEHSWIEGTTVMKALDDMLAWRSYRSVELWTVIGYQLWWRAFGSRLSDG